MQVEKGKIVTILLELQSSLSPMKRKIKITTKHKEILLTLAIMSTLHSMKEFVDL